MGMLQVDMDQQISNMEHLSMDQVGMYEMDNNNLQEKLNYYQVDEPVAE